MEPQHFRWQHFCRSHLRGRITGSTRLYDVRQCFGSHLHRPLTSKDAVVSYHTALMQNSSTRGLIAAAAETNSICFDPRGRFLASSISRYHPTIYAVNDPDPLATLESSVVPDPIHDGYCKWLGIPEDTPSAPKKLSSCCTIKHGSFGLENQTGTLHYAIGSDDFRAYVFAIPSRDELVLQREFVNREQWLHDTAELHPKTHDKTPKLAADETSKQNTTSNGDEGQTRTAGSQDDDDDDGDDSDLDLVPEDLVDHDSEVAYCSGSILRAPSIVRPARHKQFAHVLCGGRSIINTALIHPTLPLILTAGIMSDIDIHSASFLSAAELAPTTGFDTPPQRKKGGTRPRMLLLPTSASLIDQDSEMEDEEDDELDFGVAGGTDGVPLVIGFGAGARARSYAHQQVGNDGSDDEDEELGTNSEDDDDDDSQSSSDISMQQDAAAELSDGAADQAAQDQLDAIMESAAENQLNAIAAVAAADFNSDDDTPFVDLGHVTDSSAGHESADYSDLSDSEMRDEELGLFQEAQSARLPEVTSRLVQTSINDASTAANAVVQNEEGSRPAVIAEPATMTTTTETDNVAPHDDQTEENAAAEAATTAQNNTAESPVSSSSSEASSSGSKYMYRRTSSNEEALYGPAPTQSRRESLERQMNQMQEMIRAIRAEDAAERERERQRRRRRRRRRRGDLVSDDEDYVSSGEEERPPAADSSSGNAAQQQSNEGEEATVENFLSNMRNDPMYAPPTQLDFQHDRHIATYPLSNLPDHLIPSSPSTTTTTSSHEDEDPSEAGSYPYMDDNPDYDPFEDDGYHSTYASSSSLTKRVYHQLKHPSGEFDYSANGAMWAMHRRMDVMGKEQKRMRMFDELLRRDEVKSLTAGFRKVPEGNGGKKGGGNCGGQRVDSDM